MKRLSTIMLVALSSLSFGPPAGPASAQELDLLDLFSGRLTGAGEFRALDGSVRKIQGTRRGEVKNNALTLTENLTFSDGEASTTVWTFTKSGSGYVARRKEVEGPVNVSVSGNQFRMAYQATVKSKDGSTYKLSFDETYTRASGRSISNQTAVTYFLVPLCNSTMTWTKAAAN